MTRATISTQVLHPHRAAWRTVVAALVGALPLIPEIATGLHIGSIATVAQLVAIAGLVTRLLANPAVEAWLHEYVPWLATQPAPAQPPAAPPALREGKTLWD